MTNEYMTTDEVAIELRLNTQTIARYAKQGRIAGAEKAGNRYRFRRAELRLLPDPRGKDRSVIPLAPSTHTTRRQRTAFPASAPDTTAPLSVQLREMWKRRAG